eukprot:TRINITY_DN15900_c0_g1_i12.p1 TRINITY_DN15900_c0_g1~~TRINITY_DN15900_c0_g1_i12.p1  ORF type:complete len:595 (-),score=116.95 TRINITY_DN15900_c0_g1_i12:378-2162(-)
MGCVVAKPSPDSPPGSLEQMKMNYGYAGASRGRAAGPVKLPPAKFSGRLSSNEQRDEAAGAAANVGAIAKDRKVLSGERRGDGKVSRPASVKSGGDEVADGWPRWLTDNIPREALAGLVPKSAESYHKLDKIGQGTYSNVYKARDRDTGKIVALKKVRFDTSASESVKFMAREILILQKLDHPNVVKLKGLATSRMHYSLYLVFDFMHSDLARLVSHPDGKLTEPQVKCYMQQLLAGLQHCHERGILHRDIKGSNLLIDKNGMLKIADFGLANYFNPDQKRPLTSRVVTLWYRAPELLLGATDYGVGIDLWSAGCLLGEMFVGRPIMPGRTEVEQLHRIFKLCGTPPEDYGKKLKLPASFQPPQPYKPSILETFRVLPSSSLGLLTKLLALDPTDRGNASSALQSEFFSTRPLACDLSGLPVVYKGEDDESTQYHERRKNKSSRRRRARPGQEGQRKKDLGIEQPKGDSGSSKEDKEKGLGASSHSQEMGSSTGSTSSSMKPPSRHEGSPPPLLSPVASALLKSSSARTECHPWATKNITNLPPLLPTAKIRVDSNKEDGKNIYRFSLVGRSASTTDFRKLDTERKPKHYAFDD